MAQTTNEKPLNCAKALFHLKGGQNQEMGNGILFENGGGSMFVSLCLLWIVVIIMVSESLLQVERKLHCKKKVSKAFSRGSNGLNRLFRCCLIHHRIFKKNHTRTPSSMIPSSPKEFNSKRTHLPRLPPHIRRPLNARRHRSPTLPPPTLRISRPCLRLLCSQ